MKLNVFLVVDDKNIVLPTLDKHYEWVILDDKDITSYSALSKLIRIHNPVVFCTTGNNSNNWKYFEELPYQYRRKWLHFSRVDDIQSHQIENCYIYSVKIDLEKNPKNPLFSIITTTFHSGDKIYRPYNSLKSQTYRNWEWILWDDSKTDHDETWKQIQKFSEDDIRIKCYRDTNHSGFIGHMKWLSSSLSKGDWIVEVDHDDIIDDRLLQWCVDAINKYPETDFISSGFIELSEGSEIPLSYGDHFGLGYGNYQKEWIRGKWHNACPTIDMNPTTIAHIVGVPNHVRIWRRSFYEKIGRHNRELPVVDDYELLIRTLLHGNWTRIHAPAYYQYQNSNQNNFTFIRNSLIQYLSYKMYNLYYQDIQKRWKELDIDTNHDYTYSKIWEKSKGFSYNRFIKTFVPDIDVSSTISILIPVDDDITYEQLLKTIKNIEQQDYKQWIIYIIGNKSNTLENVMNELTYNYFNNDLFKRLRWWNLLCKKEFQILLNYFHRMLLVTEWIAYKDINREWSNDYLSNVMNNMNDKKCWVKSIENIDIFDTVHSSELLSKVDEFGVEEIKNIYKI